LEDLGNEDASDMTTDMNDNKCIAFPYEHGPPLTQELMHIFSAEILVDCSPQSGYSILSALLENVRAVAICRNKVHRDFITKNLSLNCKYCLDLFRLMLLWKHCTKSTENSSLIVRRFDFFRLIPLRKYYQKHFLKPLAGFADILSSHN